MLGWRSSAGVLIQRQKIQRQDIHAVKIPQFPGNIAISVAVVNVVGAPDQQDRRLACGAQRGARLVALLDQPLSEAGLREVSRFGCAVTLPPVDTETLEALRELAFHVFAAGSKIERGRKKSLREAPQIPAQNAPRRAASGSRGRGAKRLRNPAPPCPSHSAGVQNPPPGAPACRAAKSARAHARSARENTVPQC